LYDGLVRAVGDERGFAHVRTSSFWRSRATTVLAHVQTSIRDFARASDASHFLGAEVVLLKGSQAAPC
jgi:hypothetical protein